VQQKLASLSLLALKSMNPMIKKFSFTKCGSRRYFYQVLWQFLRVRLSRSNFCGFLVAVIGKMRSNYFKNRAPVRKSQILLARFVLLGD